MSLELSLYQIESDLGNLIEMREEVVGRGLAEEHSEIGREILAELTVIDNQIHEYLTAEIRKVDGIRSFWRHAELMRDAAKAEARTQNDRAKTWDDRLTRLKAMCQQVMEAIPFPPGKPKKLEGRTGALYLKQNGGKQAVTITDEALVPAPFCFVTATIRMDIWRQIEDAMRWRRGNVTEKPIGVGLGPRVPSLPLIAEALQKRCAVCRDSPTPGWRQDAGHDGEICGECGGSGRQNIAGCRLEERGSHVEVR